MKKKKKERLSAHSCRENKRVARSLRVITDSTRNFFIGRKMKRVNIIPLG